MLINFGEKNVSCFRSVPQNTNISINTGIMRNGKMELETKKISGSLPALINISV
jgi:hypothetical protein